MKSPKLDQVFFLYITLSSLLQQTFSHPTFLQPLASDLSYEEAGTCHDGAASKFIGYTGFKIQRHVSVKGMKPPLLHFVSLSSCQKGELEFERLERTGRDTDIEWNKPVCFLGSKRITDDRGVVVSRPKRNKKNKEVRSRFSRFRNITLQDVPRLPHAVNPNLRPPQVLEKRALKDKFLAFLDKISRNRFIDYFQDSKITPYEDLTPISYNNLTDQDIADVHCYKFARRKKYAMRELMLYAPLTWVGGLFECSVSDEDKKKYLASLRNSHLFAKPYELKCTSENSTLLFPLIADDMTQITREYENGALSAIRTPYLYTPSTLDPRFGLPTQVLGSATSLLRGIINKDSNDKLPYDNWFEEVEVNENYNFTDLDRSLVTSAVNNSTLLISNYLSTSLLDQWDWDIAGVFGEVEKKRPHYLELKALFSLSKIKDHTKRLDILKGLQEHWDNLKLSTEVFKHLAS